MKVNILVLYKRFKIRNDSFIVSEIMFFFFFFWGIFSFLIITSSWNRLFMTTIWYSNFDYLHIPLFNTFILLVSGVCKHDVIIMLFQVKQNDEHILEESIIALVVTILLAVLFTFYQGLEYTEASFNISDSVYGIFFCSNRFSWISCYNRNMFLTYCLFRLRTRSFWYETPFRFRILVIWYWHFVDVVWLFLYVCVYWWASLLV